MSKKVTEPERLRRSDKKNKKERERGGGRRMGKIKLKSKIKRAI